MKPSHTSLTNNAAAVLGMVVLGARSGYEIRRAAQLSLRFFWALGPPQIYTELSRLEEAALIAGQDDRQGRRPRRSYEPTSRGRSALAKWAAAQRPAPLELRDPLLLALFFADGAPRDDVRELLARMRARSTEALTTFEAEILPAATRTQARGFDQPRLVAEFGAALHGFIADWCQGRLEAEASRHA